MLVHGTMDNSASFRRVIEQLPHWNVVTYDRRGWGNSRHPRTAPTLADHVNDLLTASEWAGDRPVIAGHSYGGLIALTAAARRLGAFQALVAFEPAVRWLPWWPEEAPWERLVREARADAQAAARNLLTEIVGAPLARLRSSTELAEDGAALLTEMLDSSLDVPTFDPLALPTPAVIAAGERSLPHHIEVARRLSELLPRGCYAEFPNAGHAAHVTHPAHFADAVEQAGSL